MSLKLLVLGALAGAAIATGAQAAGPTIATEAKPMIYCQEKLEPERQLVLDAMESELDRNAKDLKMKGHENPFYMSYDLRVLESILVNGTFGAAKTKSASLTYAKAEVRVGNYSYNGASAVPVGFPTGEGYVIKRALWIASDTAIKQAQQNFLEKKIDDLKVVADEKKLDAFSKEKPNVCMGNDVTLEFDAKSLEGIAKRVSAEFNAAPDVTNSEVTLKANKATKYFMNTEGARIVQAFTFYTAIISADTIAADGEKLSNFRVFHYRSPNELPDEKSLKESVKTVLEELSAMRNAPKLGPASAPAILDSDNTGVFWHEVIGHRLEGDRQRSLFEGGTLKGKVGEKISSEMVTLVDDPTLSSFKGMTLNGYYLYDDEGMQGQKAVLVEKGVLKNYLMSRVPINGSPQSNGHGRGDGFDLAMSRMSNTMLVPEKTMGLKQMKEMAAEEAIKQGKDYYLIFRGSIGGLTATSAFTSFQAFKTIPKMVYKVDIKTGKETLMRPVEVIGTPLNMLSEIVAFGDDINAWNGTCGAESGWVPVSVIAPSMLVKKIEVQNVSKDLWDYFFGSPATPPILPPPKP